MQPNAENIIWVPYKNFITPRHKAYALLPAPQQEFGGRWVVEPGGSGGAPVTTLRYEISLVPKLSIPSAALVHVIRSGLPANMQAVALRAEEVRALCPEPFWLSHCLEGFARTDNWVSNVTL